MNGILWDFIGTSWGSIGLGDLMGIYWDIGPRDITSIYGNGCVCKWGDMHMENLWSFLARADYDIYDEQSTFSGCSIFSDNPT